MLLICLVLISFFKIAILQQLLDGPNVCTEEREYPVFVKKPSKIAYEITKYKWCLAVPPRCKVTDVVYREGFQEKLEYHKNLTKVCCPGFAQAKSRCIPICSIPCVHGICIAPDRCDCQPNYKGQYCQIECQPDELDDCKRSLPCKNGGQLINSTTGKCNCLPGYTGFNCEQACPTDTYGLNCAQKCNCTGDDAECDPIEGCRNRVSNYIASLRSEEPVQAINTSSTATILLLSMMISILLVFAFLLLKYRKKLKILSQELAFVTYISNKDSNDRFDNPIYAYQASTEKTKQLNMINPGFLPNDLNTGISKNVPKTDSSNSIDSNNVVANCLNDSLDALKNAARNYTPNIYEDTSKLKELNNKKEPEYEEIVNNDTNNKQEKEVEDEHYDASKSVPEDKAKNDL